MKNIKTFILSGLFIFSIISNSFGQSLTIDLLSYSYDGTHHDLNLTFDVKGDFQVVKGSVDLELNEFLHRNWEVLQLRFTEELRASNGYTYKVTYDKENILSELQFTLTKTGGSEGGLVSLISTGGAMNAPPGFISQGSCPVLAKATISNCSGNKGGRRSIAIGGNSDQIPFSGECGLQQGGDPSGN